VNGSPEATDDQDLRTIEAVIGTCPGVSRVAARLAVGADHDERLIAYVVGRPGTGHELAAEIRAHLLANLSPYAVPDAVVLIADLPLTAAGGTDFDLLPAPLWSAGSPRDGRQEMLCEIFAAVLELPGVGIDEDFFELGGDSMLATRLVSRIQSVLDVDLTVRDLFEAPTVAMVSDRIAGAGRARPALVPVPRPDQIPASSGQRRLWFLEQLNGAGALYSIPLALRLAGPFDESALQAALTDVLARHEALRTRFRYEDDELWQVVTPVEQARLVLRTLSIAPLTVEAALTESAGQGFDLTTELPIRATLYRLGPDDHVLSVTVHHSAADGWSVGVLLHDLAWAYGARAVGRAPVWELVTFQCADHTLWQRELLGDESDSDSRAAQGLAYWRETLADLPTGLDLPLDRPRAAVAAHRGSLMPIEFPVELHQQLLKLGRDGRATLFMVLQAGLGALLNRLGAGATIPVGIPLAGRAEPAFDRTVGLLVNTLVLRVEVGGDPTFESLLSRTRGTALAAYGEQEVPFDRLVEVLNPRRSLDRHPLFQVSLVLQNLPSSPVRFPGLSVAELQVETGLAKFDLAMALTEHFEESGDPAGMSGVIEYDADLFDPATISMLADGLVGLLAAAAAAPQTPIGELTFSASAGLAELAARPRPLAVADEPVATASGRVVTWKEQVLCDLFGEVLLLPEVGPDENFFELGGHSLLAVQLVQRLNAALGLEVGAQSLFAAPTAHSLAQHLATDVSGELLEPIVSLGSRNRGRPLFVVHAVMGLSWSYTSLLPYLDPDQVVYGLQAPGTVNARDRPSSLRELAMQYVARIRVLQPIGPYRLAGWSLGGLIAHELACVLEGLGEQVELLALIDAYPLRAQPSDQGVFAALTATLEPAAGLAPPDRATTLDRLRTGLGLSPADAERLVEVALGLSRLAGGHHPGTFQGRVLFFAASQHPVDGLKPQLWDSFVDGVVDVHRVTGSHYQLLSGPAAGQIGTRLRAELSGRK
jgi:thioesterase domain-containing protein/acyl carrier protein